MQWQVILIVLVVLVSCNAAFEDKSFLIIANEPTVQTQSMYHGTLLRILKGDQKTWSDGSRIKLVLFDFDTSQHEQFIESLGISEKWFEFRLKQKIEKDQMNVIFVDCNTAMLGIIERTPYSMGYIRKVNYEYFRNVFANIKKIRLENYF